MKIDNEIRQYVLEQISDSIINTNDLSVALKWFQNFTDKLIRNIRDDTMLWLQLPEYWEASETLQA